jgi:chromosome segregation ATPase
VTGNGESPAERLARWTATDVAIGIAAEAEQLRSQLAERRAEIDDLQARLSQLTSRVAQVEAENADLRRTASRVPLTSFARRVYRKARSVAASRLPR